MALPVLIGCASLAGCTHAPPRGCWAMCFEEPRLRCTLAGPVRVAAGEPVEVRMTLRNLVERPGGAGGAGLHLLVRDTPLEPGVHDAFLVWRGDEPMPYRGPARGPDEITRRDYVALPAGQSIEATADVAAGYRLDAPGTWRIAFQGIFGDIARAGEPRPRPVARRPPTLVYCNPITVEVVAR